MDVTPPGQDGHLDPARAWLGPHADDPDLAHLVRWAREAESAHLRLASLTALRQITAAFEAHRLYGIAGARLAADLAPGFDGSLADLVVALAGVDGLVQQRSEDPAD